MHKFIHATTGETMQVFITEVKLRKYWILGMEDVRKFHINSAADKPEAAYIPYELFDVVKNQPWFCRPGTVFRFAGRYFVVEGTVGPMFTPFETYKGIRYTVRILGVKTGWLTNIYEIGIKGEEGIHKYTERKLRSLLRKSW